jgi:hypothetical protein
MADPKNADPKSEVEILKAALAAQAAQFERLIGAVADMAQPTDAAIHGLSPAKQKAILAVPSPQKWRTIRGKSAETGSTFDMIVLESKTHKTGRVVRLETYAYPPGIEVAQAHGGLLPDGMRMRNPLTNDGLDPLYKQWRYQNFWRADLNSIASGQPLRPEHCVDAGDIQKVAWMESKGFGVPGDEEAA